MIKRESNVHIDLNDDISWSTKLTSNNIPILEQNYIDRMNSNNGWSKDRHFKKLAHVPQVALLKAEQEGYDMDDKNDVLRFLADNPEFRCSDYYVTPGSNNHKIIIK